LEGDSGMYQCSVSNGTSSVWRQWRLQVVRQPGELIWLFFCMDTKRVIISSYDTYMLKMQTELYVFGIGQIYCLYNNLCFMQVPHTLPLAIEQIALKVPPHCMHL
jgi:hypothetical protein